MKPHLKIHKKHQERFTPLAIITSGDACTAPHTYHVSPGCTLETHMILLTSVAPTNLILKRCQYEFYIATVIYYHELSLLVAQRNTHWLSNGSVGQKFKMGFPGLTARCQQGGGPCGGSRKIISLTFPAFKGYTVPWFVASPSKLAIPSLHLCFHRHTSFWLSILTSDRCGLTCIIVHADLPPQGPQPHRITRDPLPRKGTFTGSGD